jgi:ABC-type transport system substrate-binding protein
LTVSRGTLPESWYREADLLWKKNMDAIGIRMVVQQQTFGELLNLSLAGKLQMFNLGYRALAPSGYEILQTLWGKGSNDTNRSRFRRPEFDEAYEKFVATPDGPERLAAVRRMNEVVAAYVPMTLHTHGISNVIVQPWVMGYTISAFGSSWKYLDLDNSKRR